LLNLIKHIFIYIYEINILNYGRYCNERCENEFISESEENNEADPENSEEAHSVNSEAHLVSLVNKWRKEFGWLTYLSNEGIKLFCNLCIEPKMKNNFTLGYLKAFKKDNLNKHQKSKDHLPSKNKSLKIQGKILLLCTL